MPVSIVLSPVEFVTSPGVAVRLNASSSYDTDGEILSFTWEFTQIPVGSRVEAADISSADIDFSSVIFTPDQVGTYVVQLTVENESGDTATALATIMCQYSLGFTKEPTTPDASYMFSILPDFWKNVANNEVFSILWSGYTQAVGTDISRVYQNSDAKSLATIRSLYERRWLPYHPLYSLEGIDYTAIIGDVQGGLGARTTDDSQTASAVVISHQELVLIDEVPSEKAVGQNITITSGGNTGSYLVLRVNSDGTGYIVQRNSLDPVADTIASGGDLYGVRTSTVFTSVATDFAAAGVVAGDILKLVAGADSGFYSIEKVGVVDGLLNDRQIQVATSLIRNRTRVAFSVLRPCGVSVDFPGTAYTTRVYLPTSEADLLQYSASSFSGIGNIRGPYEIVVPLRHVFDSMVGKQLLVTSGPDGGATFVVSAVNASRDGYFLSSAFSASAGTACGYTLSAPYAITDRLITVGGVTAPIIAATLLGTEWAVTVPPDIVPAGLENAAWYIGHVCTVTSVDVEEEGASVGDLLLFTAKEARTGYATEVSAAVLGCYANKIMFANGKTIPILTAGSPAVSAFTDYEIYKFFSELVVPTATYDSATETGALSRIAASVAAEIGSSLFKTKNFNLPISNETVLTADAVSVTVSLSGLLRNTKLKVNDYLVSAPALFEYIKDPNYQKTGTNTYTVVSTDQTTTERTTPPVVLQHNDEFIVDYDLQLKGRDASIVAGSDTVTVPAVRLLSVGISPGDTLSLRVGATTSTYLICAVLGEETLKVRPTTGSSTTFSVTSSNLVYKITRRIPYNYLRLMPGEFTSTSPAPRHLWAEISLFDNSPTIEANFGTLVGITKYELDQYGSSQDSYLTVVRGLAYGLVNGPTLLNVVTAANLLLGAPVTPKIGIIHDIDEDFSPSQGKVTIQDIDLGGIPQASYRSFLYAREGYAAPGFYGLATNPITGTALAVGDVVLDNQVLSRSVAITDYVEDPYWWRRYGSLAGKELEKYHSWELVADLLQLPAEDLTLVADFVMMARPVYTKPNVVGLLYLLDEVTVEDDLSFEGTLLLFDDPAFSVESTHMVDDYDESSVSLRAVDVGSFGTRVLFRGRDLRTLGGTGAGTVTVVSARGGFIGPLNSDVNSYFSSVETRGSSLVKAANDSVKFPGDILRILSGPNAGVYEISEVVSDTELTVRQFNTSYFYGTGVSGPPPDEMTAAEDQEFTIQRVNGPLITHGTGTVEVGSAVLTDASGNFIVNNATVGDVILLIDSGGLAVERLIIDVLRDTSGTQDSTQVVLDKESDNSDTVEYYIYREALFQNPIFVTNTASTDGTATISTLGHSGAFLRAGDIVEIVVGDPADTGKTFRIVGIPNSNQMIVRLGAETLAPAVGVTIRVTRPLLDAAEDSDSALEALWTGDDTLFEVMRPVEFVVPSGVVTDASVVVATSTITSATDFAAIGVTPGMRVQFANSSSNSGVYEILLVSANTIVLSSPPNFDETGVSLSVLKDAAEFIVTPFGGVTTVSGYNLKGDISFDPLVASLLPGDIFEYAGNQVMLSSVGATNFHISSPPPLVGVYPGVIRRTRRT